MTIMSSLYIYLNTRVGWEDRLTSPYGRTNLTTSVSPHLIRRNKVRLTT